MTVDPKRTELTNDILELFKKHHPMVGTDSLSLPRARLHEVLVKVDSDAFEAERFNALCKEVLEGQGDINDDTLIPLDKFLDYLSGNLEDLKETGDLQEFTKRLSKAASDVGDREDAIRFRTVGGNLALVLSRRQLANLDIVAIKADIRTNLDKMDCIVRILVEEEEITEAQQLKDILARQESDDPVEAVAMLRHLPPLSDTMTIPEKMAIIAEWLEFPDDKVRLDGIVRLRKLLSIERDPPVADCINAGLLPITVELCSSDTSLEIRFEALWSLTNIASGTSEQTRALVDAGGAAAFVEALSSQSEHVVEQAVWGIGNVAGDCAEMRDVILSMGCVEKLCDINASMDNGKLTFKRNLAWTFSNLVRGRPAPDFEVVRPVLQHLAQAIQIAEDHELLADICWGLSYLTDGSNDRIQVALDVGILSNSGLMRALNCGNAAVHQPALRVVGNIVSGDDLQTEAVLRAGFLEHVPSLLKSTKGTVQKEVAWAVSNILAGTSEQIQQVMDANGIDHLVNFVLEHPNYTAVHKEICWCLANMTSGGTPVQMATLVQKQGLEALAVFLPVQEGNVRKTALTAIHNISRDMEKLHSVKPSTHDIWGQMKTSLLQIVEAEEESEVESALFILEHLPPLLGIEGEDAAGPGTTTSAPSPVGDDCYKVSIRVGRKGQPWGLALVDEALNVKAVEGSLIHSYNSTDPDPKAVDGDRVVAVDGVAGLGPELHRMLAKKLQDLPEQSADAADGEGGEGITVCLTLKTTESLLL
mmetsp:Transcript_12870/g.28173  ORF Transcript_12870/g.28173 Transcript_12870/m.28173 type:complete len:760 (+) Transcript_12870:194-2473(+)|eukprot:CAMPEP_0206450818 /NCGR_PEP_ID=MMETSP0324_2-20121206/18962_1 /ASSEMBLY_ACC=CAM_ASM_000836 /TAXON_ID=2866 /ORGANISM="Crypthecodinium cohnii, Strain Seligo" /LENGTH=759 /DNA_ID=CAMNT_0053920561 /DNA_START=132 /DNA_END=2411 /DNA_ORIENTATION=-